MGGSAVVVALGWHIAAWVCLFAVRGVWVPNNPRSIPYLDNAVLGGPFPMTPHIFHKMMICWGSSIHIRIAMWVWELPLCAEICWGKAAWSGAWQVSMQVLLPLKVPSLALAKASAVAFDESVATAFVRLLFACVNCGAKRFPWHGPYFGRSSVQSAMLVGGCEKGCVAALWR